MNNYVTWAVLISHYSQAIYIRLRVTGRVTGLPRSWHPRATSRWEDWTIKHAHLRDRHLSANETARCTIGSHNRPIHPKNCKESTDRGQGWERSISLRVVSTLVSLWRHYVDNVGWIGCVHMHREGSSWRNGDRAVACPENWGGGGIKKFPNTWSPKHI